MQRSLARRYWLLATLLLSACGGPSGDLFGSGEAGGATSGGAAATSGGASGTGGAATTSGGVAATGGIPSASGGLQTVSGGAGGAAGTSSTGGAAGAGGVAGRGGASAAGAGAAGRGGGGGTSGSGGVAGNAGGAGGRAGGGVGGKAGGGASGSSGAANAGAAGAAACDTVRANLPMLLSTAQACNAALDRLPCTGFVSNECGCKVPVDLANSSATQSYMSAVAQVIQCGVVCPDILCLVPVSARCQTEGTQTMGRCVAP